MVVPLDHEPLESLNTRQLADMVRRLRKALSDEKYIREYNSRALLQSISQLSEQITGKPFDLRLFEKPKRREQAQETGLCILGISVITALLGWPLANWVI